MSTSEPNSTESPTIDSTRPSQIGALDTLEAFWTVESLDVSVSVSVADGVAVSPAATVPPAAPAPSATVNSRVRRASSTRSAFSSVNDTTQSPASGWFTAIVIVLFSFVTAGVPIPVTGSFSQTSTALPPPIGFSNVATISVGCVVSSAPFSGVDSTIELSA